MARSRKKLEAGELPIAPMIDVVFLLLIYFMVSSSIQKQEADMRFSLPAKVASAKPIEFPDQTIIELDSDGVPSVNGYAYAANERGELRALSAMLNRYRASSESSGGKAKVVLAPGDDSPHESVVRVLDACETAGIQSVSFAVE